MYKIKTRSKIWLSRYIRGKQGKAGVLIICIFVILALLGPFLIPYPANAMSSQRFQPPSLRHIFGTDYLGHDIFSQLITGAFPSMIVGILASLGATFLGTIVGAFSGYFQKLEGILMAATDTLMTIPILPLLILAGTIFIGTNELVLSLLILLLWPPIARSVRSQVLSISKKTYVEATKRNGLSDLGVIRRIIIPEIFPIVLAYFVLSVATSIVIIAALELLGIGNPNVISWGSMLYWAQQYAFYNGAWWWFLAPGLAITLLALGFALVGFSFEETTNPRLREA
jgi:peptide/nickel transport system permease protein